MSYTQVKLNNASAEFKRGFMAALDFLDGADGFQIYHSDETSVTLLTEIAGGDNTFVVNTLGRVVFDSTGVEL